MITTIIQLVLLKKKEDEEKNVMHLKITGTNTNHCAQECFAKKEIDVLVKLISNASLRSLIRFKEIRGEKI